MVKKAAKNKKKWREANNIRKGKDNDNTQMHYFKRKENPSPKMANQKENQEIKIILIRILKNSLKTKELSTKTENQEEG